MRLSIVGRNGAGCCASKEKNGAGSCQIMDYFEESRYVRRTGWSPDMERPPPDQNDSRYIARRLFNELRALYPDRYIALIEQPPLLPHELAPAKAFAAPQKPITL